jgi:hypothetical protein
VLYICSAVGTIIHGFLEIAIHVIIHTVLRDFNNDDLFPNRPAQPKLVATAPSPVQTADCDTSLVVPYSTIYIGCEFSVL